MRIVTWNVNSVRVRMEQAADWIRENEPDVLCMQEIKSVDDQFPAEDFRELGYECLVYGQKTYNGVAIASRVGLERPARGFADGDEEDPHARIVRADCGGVRVVNLYVPNGKEVDSEPYEYKLGWFGRLRRMLDDQEDAAKDVVLLGDFNVAPEDRDVWDPERWRGKVHCSEPEREALGNLSEWGLHDCLRKHHEEEGIYSWWDYRRLAYVKRRGLRIDLVLATDSLAERCTDCVVDRKPRKLKRPSDHAPVVADFA